MNLPGINLPILRRNYTPSVIAGAADAARKETGTSLTAKGHVDEASITYDEYGSTYQSQLPEQVPELASAYQQNLAYTSMYRSDVSVRVGLRCAEAPVLGGDYTVEAYDDSSQADIIRQFVEWQLFSAGGPWLRLLSQIMKMVRDGYQPFEPVWELREWSAKGANRRQYTSLKKLAVRPPSTISEINYDNYGNLDYMVQQAIGANFKSREVILPANKLLVFTFDQNGGDVRGESILRPAYPHWYMKQKLYAIDAVQKERHGIGVPDIELQPGFTNKDVAAGRQLGSNLRTNEKAYILRTTTMKVGFAEIKTQPVNALDSAIHHDMMIMKNILVQFLNTDTSSGGRATSASMMDMFMKAMRYLGNYICEMINYYLIPPMVGYNFDVDTFPKLCVRNIGEAKDLQMWGSAMSNLINADAIQVDDETEQFIRRVTDVPKRTTPFVDMQLTKKNILLQGEASTEEGAAANKPAGAPDETGGKGRPETTGNIGTSPSSAA